MSNRPAGVYLETPNKGDKCNFIHKETDSWEVPATAVLEFQLNSGQYTQVLRVCYKHLEQIHNVTRP